MRPLDTFISGGHQSLVSCMLTAIAALYLLVCLINMLVGRILKYVFIRRQATELSLSGTDASFPDLRHYHAILKTIGKRLTPHKAPAYLLILTGLFPMIQDWKWPEKLCKLQQTERKERMQPARSAFWEITEKLPVGGRMRNNLEGRRGKCLPR